MAPPKKTPSEAEASLAEDKSMATRTKKKSTTTGMEDEDHGMGEEGALGAGSVNPRGPILEEQEIEGTNTMDPQADVGSTF